VDGDSALAIHVAGPDRPSEGGIPWPDPPARRAFHGLAGEIVGAIEPHTEADPVALLVQLLVAFGNAVGRVAHFIAEADRHFLNLYAMLVGVTSKSRKGSSWGHVFRIFRAIAPEWAQARVQSGLSSGEGLIWAVRDPITKHEPMRERSRIVGYQDIEVDGGVTDKRLLVYEPEFAATLRVLGRDGNTLSALLRQAWDTGELRALTKHSPAQATGAHISIVGHITRGELLHDLDASEAFNGFANRFLWVCVARSKALPDGGRLKTAALEPLQSRLAAAIEFARTVGELIRDDDARTLWHQVYADLSEGRPGLFGAVTSRAEAQVMRLACLYALLDGRAVVGRCHLEAALALWTYCRASCRFIFGDSVGNAVADQLLRFLKCAPNGRTRTEIRDHFKRHRTAAQIDGALDLLGTAGHVRCVEERTDGRPAERWYAVGSATNAT